MLDAPSRVRPARLSHDEQAAIATYAAKASWPTGFLIYQRGAAADGVFIVVSGRIVLRSRVKAGRAFVPAIAVAGETFGAEGLSGGARYATDARADEESETLHLSGTRFRAFLRERPQDALSLISQVVTERTGLLEKLRELATLSVEQRLIATLLRMAQHNTFTDDAGRIVLGPSQYRLLCELVGATRESVSLVLGRLVGEGIAEREGGSIVIAPPATLAARLESPWADTESPLAVVGDARSGLQA
jgi:CRP/FNR family transcriptional regulator, cyclic AMP receptor protein